MQTTRENKGSSAFDIFFGLLMFYMLVGLVSVWSFEKEYKDKVPTDLKVIKTKITSKITRVENKEMICYISDGIFSESMQCEFKEKKCLKNSD